MMSLYPWSNQVSFSSWPFFPSQEIELGSYTANMLILSQFNSGSETKTLSKKQ